MVRLGLMLCTICEYRNELLPKYLSTLIFCTQKTLHQIAIFAKTYIQNYTRRCSHHRGHWFSAFHKCMNSSNELYIIVWKASFTSLKNGIIGCRVSSLSLLSYMYIPDINYFIVAIIPSAKLFE